MRNPKNQTLPPQHTKKLRKKTQNCNPSTQKWTWKKRTRNQYPRASPGTKTKWGEEMTEVSEAALLIQRTLMRSMRQQTRNISHSRKDYSHARHATSLYTKSWLCDCRAMMNTALQTLMRHLHRLFTLFLSLSLFCASAWASTGFLFLLAPCPKP